MDARYLAEAVGTMVFLAIILKSGGDKYVIVAGLLAAILLMGDVSGGHFNPAVSFMQYLGGNMTTQDLIGYSASQFIGAYLAMQLVNYLK